MTTTWLPSNKPAIIATNGALCVIGPVTSSDRSGCTRSSVPSAPTASASAGLVATMSFGRPVEPPLVTTFHSGDRTAGASNRAAVASPAAAATSAADSTGRPPASTSAPPSASRSAASAATTSAGSASARIAARSAAGSREEIGWGVAPSSHAASAAWTNSIPFGSASVTHEPGPTPRSANTDATRSTEATSSARVRVLASAVSAGRSGAAAARPRMASTNGVGMTPTYDRTTATRSGSPQADDATDHIGSRRVRRRAGSLGYETAGQPSVRQSGEGRSTGASDDRPTVRGRR